MAAFLVSGRSTTEAQLEAPGIGAAVESELRL
jgi:hypothetical protein